MTESKSMNNILTSCGYITGYKVIGQDNWILRDSQDDDFFIFGRRAKPQTFSNELVKNYFSVWPVVEGKHWWNEKQVVEKISRTGYYGKVYVLKNKSY
jgi:hypothetical protein